MRSIVGRFLEHTRVYYFKHGGEDKLFCASADWMGRNLFSRVETCFPILNKKVKKKIFEDGLINYLHDNQGAWELSATGEWHEAQPVAGQSPHSAQQYLLNQKLLKI